MSSPFFIKQFRPMLEQRFEKKIADDIYVKATILAMDYEKKCPDVASGTGVVTFPLAGLYVALQDEVPAKEAKGMLLEYAPVVANKLRKIIKLVTGIPGVSNLIWNNMEKIMASAGSEKQGYRSKNYGVQDGIAAMDILVCPIVETFKILGVPEIGCVVCAMDQIYSTGYHGIAFERTRALANGDECCDYRYTRIEKESKTKRSKTKKSMSTKDNKYPDKENESKKKSQLLYKFLSSFYDLLDVIYFRRYESSPRKVVFDSIEKQDAVLDLCTGTATNAIAIAKRKPRAKVVGIDLSKDMLHIAKSKVHKEKLSNIKLYQMDATNMKFKNECFDKVLISLVLHEMDDELAQAIINEAVRVLKPDGEIIVTEWRRSKELQRRILFAPVEVLEPKPYKAFIKKDLAAYFKKFGLEVKSQSVCDYTVVLRLAKQK